MAAADANPLAAELAAIRERLENASPGEWIAIADDHGRKGIEHSVWSETADAYVAEHVAGPGEACFIALARADIPRLLAAVGAALELAAEFNVEDGHNPGPGDPPVSRGDKIREAITRELLGEDGSDEAAEAEREQRRQALAADVQALHREFVMKLRAAAPTSAYARKLLAREEGSTDER